METFNTDGFAEFSPDSGIANNIPETTELLKQEHLKVGFESFVSPDVVGHQIQKLESDKVIRYSFLVSDKTRERLKPIFESGEEQLISYDDSFKELQYPTKSIYKLGCRIQLADGVDIEGRQVKVMEGAIFIDIQKDPDISLDKVLTDVLNINREMGEEQDRLKLEMTKNMFILQNKTDLQQQNVTELEVSNGYLTKAVAERSTEFTDKHGAYAFSHTFIGMDPEAIADALKSIVDTGGLLCANERLKRKISAEARVGFFPSKDMRSGGANYVFTTIISEHNPDNKYTVDLILDPKLADRLDWYSYPRDSYGADPETNSNLTETPDQAISRLASGNIRGEQFFKYGISLKDVLFVSCGDAERRDLLISTLKNNGVDSVNGVPVPVNVMVASLAVKVPLA